MSIVRTRGNDRVCARRRRAVAGLAACSTAQAQDPCALLSAAEAVPYVGPLATPPYRASDGAADIRGDQCMYRGKDGRQLTVAPDWSGGGTAANSAVQGAANLVGSALAKAAGPAATRWLIAS